LAKDNLDLLIDLYENSLDRIMKVLKDAFDPKNNACIEHTILMITALIVDRPVDALFTTINLLKLPLLMLQMIDNEKVH
jgi:hypothetical protein